MQQFFALIRKELRGYFFSPVAYVFIAVFLAAPAWLFFLNFFLVGQLSMDAYFGFLPWVFLFLIPAVSMRLWAEETKEGTLELLLAWPTTTAKLVLGKYCAGLIFISCALLLSLSIPFSVASLGALDWGTVAVGYLGAWLLAAVFLALGSWISALTENQIIAFLATACGAFALYIMGTPLVTYFAPHILTPFVSYIGAASHYKSSIRGVIDSRDIIYAFSCVAIFLFMTGNRIAKKRW